MFQFHGMLSDFTFTRDNLILRITFALIKAFITQHIIYCSYFTLHLLENDLNIYEKI